MHTQKLRNQWNKTLYCSLLIFYTAVYVYTHTQMNKQRKKQINK